MDIALLTSGGDCAGMNPAIKYFVERCRDGGHRPWGVSSGYEGLIDGDIRELSYEHVGGIVSEGGSVLKCSRSERFLEVGQREIAARKLAERGVDHLVVLGGEGSLKALEIFGSEHEIRCAGIPATIDNDVPGSSYSLGVDSALNVIRRGIDEVRDTASSFRRAFVIETMGRDCGYLALVSAIVSGAEVCIIPEIPHDLDRIKRRLRRDFAAGRDYAIAVVSEGVEGAGAQLLEWFQRELSIDSRLTVLGHTQRGGSPTVFDRLMSIKFVEEAIAGFESGDGDFSVVQEGGAMVRNPLGGAGNPAPPPALTPQLLALGERLCR